MVRTGFALVTAIVCGTLASGCAPSGYASHARGQMAPPDSTAPMPMTKNDVIELSKARIGDDVILSMLNISQSSFVLRTKEVIELADSGVSDKVIDAMLKSGEPGQRTERASGYAGMYWSGAWSPYWYPYWSPWNSFSYGGYGWAYSRPFSHYSSFPRHTFAGRQWYHGGHSSGGGWRGGGRRR